MKKLLILGNGFDLAHGLQTKYSQFLDFCRDIIKVKFVDSVTGESFFNDSKILKSLCNSFSELDTNAVGKMCELLTENIWYNYLQDIHEDSIMKGENWIDFESEISYVIQIIDEHTISLSHLVCNVIDALDNNSMDFNAKFNHFYQLVKDWGLHKLTIRGLRSRLFIDLKKLSIALEIYLSEFVLMKQIHIYSPDIRAIGPDYVINFNYTNIYSKIYYSSFPEFHIHGSCRNDVFVGVNNMVLGIDEYWSEQERDDHTNFTIFKKFAQRIQRKTGKEHFEICNELKELKKNNNERVCVYIFGHSLDVTDKDILKMFFDEDFEVTIFCRDEETEGEYIANVIKIIGEQKLIERVNQNPPTIIFKQQLPMEDKAPDATVKPDLEEEEEPEDELVTAK